MRENQRTTSPPTTDDIDRICDEVARNLRVLAGDAERLAKALEERDQLQTNLAQLDRAREILRAARDAIGIDDTTSRETTAGDLVRGMATFVPGETPPGRWWIVEDIKGHWSGSGAVVVSFSTSADGRNGIEMMLGFDEKVRVRR